MSELHQRTSSQLSGPPTKAMPETTPEATGSLGTLTAGPVPLRPPSVTVPRQTGRYVILGEIARGGMAAVLLAHDQEMDRTLAIKVPFDDFETQPESVRRFLEEARVSGQLQHPGIVPIYELGHLADRRPYFTMKLVQGRTLAALLAERRDPTEGLPRLLKVFEQVCQTLAYAHSRGIIHRDLKPANIMVGEFGEVQVMDWGLAKVIRAPAAQAQPATDLAHDPHATEAGAVMGTLSYMPPEQARGEIAKLDERCDVFGLGAILCTVLTGLPPYTGRFDEIQEKATRGDLTEALARLDACRADAELLDLARACLAPDPQQRPRDAGAVALIVTSYLAGVQERLHQAEVERAAAQARAAEARAKAAAERRALRLTVGLTGVLLLGAIGAGAGMLWLSQQRARANATVNNALLQATQLHEQARAADTDRLRWAAAVSALEKAQALAMSGHVDEELRQRVADAFTAVKDEEQKARQRMEQAEKYRRLLARFEDIRLRLSDVYGQGAEEYARAARDGRAALRENGLDVDDLDEKTAVARIRALPPSVAQALVVALDDWVFAEWVDYWNALVRKTPPGQKINISALLLGNDPVLNRKMKVWRRRLAIAQQADTDPLRKQLRGAVTRMEFAKFKKIVESEDVAALPPSTVCVSAEILFALGDVNRAAGLLRQAQERRYTNDFWINYRLAYFSALRKPPAWDDSVRYATAAVALRPNCVEALRLLGYALAHRQDTEGAIAAFQQLLRVKSDDALAHGQLGFLFARKNDLKQAASWYRKAVALDSTNFQMHWNLGRVLRRAGDLDGAIAALREADRLHANDPALQSELRSVMAQRAKR